MIDPLYDSRNPNHDRIGGLRVMRCPICDWPMTESREKGCIPSDCSYRPDDPVEQRRIKERRDSIKTAQGKSND